MCWEEETAGEVLIPTVKITSQIGKRGRSKRPSVHYCPGYRGCHGYGPWSRNNKIGPTNQSLTNTNSRCSISLFIGPRLRARHRNSSLHLRVERLERLLLSTHVQGGSAGNGDGDGIFEILGNTFHHQINIHTRDGTSVSGHSKPSTCCLHSTSGRQSLSQVSRG